MLLYTQEQYAKMQHTLQNYKFNNTQATFIAKLHL